MERRCGNGGNAAAEMAAKSLSQDSNATVSDSLAPRERGEGQGEGRPVRRNYRMPLGEIQPM
jgi:hypothetical protein